MNPWDLTESEARVMDAVVSRGCVKLACKDLGISPKAAEAVMFRVRKRMRATFNDRIKYLIRWGVWRETGKELT